MRHGETLASWRLRNELSQVEAATKIGVSQSTWAYWETGQKIPNRDSAFAIERLTNGAVLASGWPAKKRRKLRRVERKAIRPSTPPRAA